MSGRTMFFIFSFILMSGCAEPKYVNVIDSQLQSQGAPEPKMDCQSSFSSSGLCLTWHWEKRPTSSEAGSLIFKTYRLNKLDQTPIEVDLALLPQVILWMPSMGHGSSPTQTTRVDDGTYRTTNVFFVMPGEWEIYFQVKNDTEVIDETRVRLVF